jgi:nucleoside-diphosphate-sugar epimerase
MSSTMVTGGLGFVGSKLVQKLVEKNVKTILLVREHQKELSISQFGNVVKALTINEILEEKNLHEVRNVVNLAGKYYFNPTQNESDEMIESNIVLPKKLGNALSDGPGEINWIQASTFMQHVDSRPFFPSCFYAATKYSAECELTSFSDRGIAMTALILPQIFGENDKRKKLLNYLIQQIEKNEEIQVSSGTQVMDLVHVDDIVDAIMLCIQNENNVGRYQISSMKPYTIKQLIDLIFQSAAKSVPVTYDTAKDRLYEPKEIWQCADPLSGWISKYPIDKWIKNHFKTQGKS